MIPLMPFHASASLTFSFGCTESFFRFYWIAEPSSYSWIKEML